MIVSVYAPTFTLSDYSNVSVGRGNSTTSYVNVNPQYGFTGNVSLAVTGLPSGVTASFSPNPTATGSSLLTLTASSTASLGQYNVIITGTSGSAIASTTLSVGVYAPTFTLYDYSSVAVGQGSSTTSYVSVTPSTAWIHRQCELLLLVATSPSARLLHPSHAESHRQWLQSDDIDGEQHGRSRPVHCDIITGTSSAP